MRVLRQTVPIVLLISLSLAGNGLLIVPAANADEVTKIKERGQPKTQEVQSKPKQPINPPRPPDKYHPIKKPPDNRPPQPPPPPPPPQPRIDPPGGRPELPDDPWCPPVYPVIRPIPEPPVYVPPSPPQIVELRDVLLRRLRLMEIEGFEGQVAVGWDGQLYFQQTCGGVIDGPRFGVPPTMYDIAGVTRAFTAWATYELIESRKLTLWTTLGELFPGAPADKQGITIEQLLANTSGLGNTWAADGEADRNTAVGNLLAQPLAHAPGAEFTYSDDGYVILAAAIEVASGMAYESYLLDSGVVTPDMKNTAFWSEAGPSSEEWGQRGSGGILSTAFDLYRWTSRFLAGPELMVEEITRPRILTEADQGIAYGWYWTNPDSDSPIMFTRGTGYRDHNVMVVVYPSNAVLVVTSGQYNGDVPWSERVANALEPVLIHAEPPATWVVGYQYPVEMPRIQQ